MNLMNSKIADDGECCAVIVQSFPVPCCGAHSVCVQEDHFGAYVYCAVCWCGLESPVGAGPTIEAAITDWNKKQMSR